MTELIYRVRMTSMMKINQVIIVVLLSMIPLLPNLIISAPSMSSNDYSTVHAHMVDHHHGNNGAHSHTAPVLMLSHVVEWTTPLEWDSFAIINFLNVEALSFSPDTPPPRSTL